MKDDDKLNNNEANLNNYIGTNIDYKHPSEVYGYGVPGLGMSYDRKRQLNFIDKNLDFTKTLSNNTYETNINKMNSENNIVSKSVNNFKAQQVPKNDYHYIRYKNSSWGNKFDIISNKIKDFAK